MSFMCEHCAYKMADCKGDKNGPDNKPCDFYKKPTVFNAKALVEENAKLKQELDRWKHSGTWTPTVGKWDDVLGVYEAKVWECDQCLYDWDGTEPPEYCPGCGSYMSKGDWEENEEWTD